MELAEIEAQKSVAQAQDQVLVEAVKSANIDSVGGEMQFLNRILESVNRGKSLDGLINNSANLRALRDKLVGNDEPAGRWIECSRRMARRRPDRKRTAYIWPRPVVLQQRPVFFSSR